MMCSLSAEKNYVKQWLTKVIMMPSNANSRKRKCRYTKIIKVVSKKVSLRNRYRNVGIGTGTSIENF